MRRTETVYEIIEEGFFCDRFSVEASGLKKSLRVMIKKEFPRSHKIWVYAMEPYPQEEPHGTERKKI
ncbi:MAG: hypothetical protein HY788_00220 [Deltaproteobacteria bacterium]|nr:hypothetical protein [Deltaproteobacteria bacterium]